MRIWPSTAATTYQIPALRTSPSGSRTRRAAPLAAVVVDRDPGPVPDRVRQGAQVRHRLARLEPLAGIEVEALDQPRGAGPQLRRQRGEDLELRGRDDRPETELRGRSRQSRQEERLGLLAGHPGQARPVAVDEPDPAVRPALRVDRDARRAERLDVAMDGPLGDLELLGELGGGQLAAGLEQQEERHEARRTHAGRIPESMTGCVMFTAAGARPSDRGGRWTRRSAPR